MGPGALKGFLRPGSRESTGKDVGPVKELEGGRGEGFQNLPPFCWKGGGGGGCRSPPLPFGWKGGGFETPPPFLGQKGGGGGFQNPPFPFWPERGGRGGGFETLPKADARRRCLKVSN